MSSDCYAPSVPEFYSGKSVFITGGTGFLGKVLMEKLLYSCPDIEKIYVLIRKSGKNKEKQTMENLVKSPVFTRLKAERPQQLAKIIAVAGDLCVPNLGINIEDEGALLENVSIVFHSAANVKFNITLREALRTNVEGTRHVFEVSRRMKKLEVFIHVSSAFAQLDKLVVEEVVYPPPARLEDVYEFLEKHEQDGKKERKLLKGFHNTYTFTKALAETLLVERRGRIPLVILRPSVVMPAISEPMEGWVDIQQGAVRMFNACAKGWLRVAPGRDSVVADLIPVDFVTNMAIIAAFKCAGSNKVEVFHCCSSGVNPITWQQAIRYYIEEAKKNRFNDLACPFFCLIKRDTMETLASCLTEKVPAYILDLLRMVRRQEPRYVRYQLKYEALRNAFRLFFNTSWQFRCERAQALIAALPPAATAFPCNVRDIQWQPYLAACHRGTVAYLYKERDANINAANLDLHNSGEVEMLARTCGSTVSKFYDGKSVLITGATGFVGKVLIEKLLYRCSGIEKVYVLIRKTAQQNENQRLEGLLQSAAFARIRKDKPQALGKIIPVAGDLTLPNLGIRHHDEETLLENVAIVFNVAASVNFIAPLQNNFTLNVEGTERILDLSRRIKRLEGFVHISTAFCNYDVRVSEEVVYPPPARREDVYKFLDNKRHSKKELKKLLNGHPNTYTFTKALAETLVVEKRGTMPTAILRPAIIMPSLAEPMPGWIDNWQGAIALMTASAKGRVRSILGADHYITDLIPVDYVANMAAIVATKCTSEVAVYHCCTSSVNPLDCRDSNTYFVQEAVKNGFNDKMASLPHVAFFKHATIVEAFVFLTQTVPAYFLDLLRIIRKEKPRYIKGLAMITTLRKAMEPFIDRSWHFRNERAQELLRSLPPADRRLFPCHPSDIQWQPYLAACFRGVKQYLLKKR